MSENSLCDRWADWRVAALRCAAVADAFMADHCRNHPQGRKAIRPIEVRPVLLHELRLGRACTASLRPEQITIPSV